MRTDTIEKEKEVRPVVQKKPLDPVVIIPGASKPPAFDLDAAQALQSRRFAEESTAREKELLAELDVRVAMLHRQLEASFEL